MRKLLLVLGGLAVLAATPAVAADRVCIRQDNIRNWSSPNDRTVILEDYRHQKVLLKLIGTCNNLAFHESIAIRSFGGSGLDCVGVGDTLATGHRLGEPRGSCSIVSVTPYTGDMHPHEDHDSPS